MGGVVGQELEPGMTVKQKLSVFGFIVLAFIVFGGLGYWGYTAYVEENKARWEAEKAEIDEAARLANSTAAVLSQNTDGKSKFAHHNEETDGPLPTDPWGTRLRVTYNKPWFKNERLKVVSAGPDKQFDTKDDISSSEKVR